MKASLLWSQAYLLPRVISGGEIVAVIYDHFDTLGGCCCRAAVHRLNKVKKHGHKHRGKLSRMIVMHQNPSGRLSKKGWNSASSQN